MNFLSQQKLSLSICISLALCVTTGYAQDATPTNLALGAKVEVSSRASADQDGNKITDGNITNEGRWLSAASGGPHIATINLAKAQTLGAVQVLSGWEKNKKWKGQIKEFVVQYRAGGEWKNLPEGEISENDKAFLNIKLAKPVDADGLRLVIQDKSTVRVFEVRAYPPSTSYPEESWPMIAEQ